MLRRCEGESQKKSLIKKKKNSYVEAWIPTTSEQDYLESLKK